MGLIDLIATPYFPAFFLKSTFFSFKRDAITKRCLPHTHRDLTTLADQKSVNHEQTKINQNYMQCIVTDEQNAGL